MIDFDALFEAGSRLLAGRTSRRGMLAKAGGLLVASAVTLPVARGQAAETDPDQQCDYWKYCSVDGFLCTCCGGTTSSCPPGTEPSQASWVGTCQDPASGKSYMISYTDCCGMASCGRCGCNNNVGERPGYSMGIHNDINWCMANGKSTIYNCTVTLTLGEA